MESRIVFLPAVLLHDDQDIIRHGPPMDIRPCGSHIRLCGPSSQGVYVNIGANGPGNSAIPILAAPNAYLGILVAAAEF